MNTFGIGIEPQDVNIYTYKYFPVRKTKLTQNGGGAWCVDFVNKKINHMKLLNKHLTIEDNIGLSLNSEFLIKEFYLKDPSDACVLNLSGRSLHPLVNADFSLFKNVSEVDASDNNLTLDAFCTFPTIEKLFLQANNMKFIDVDCERFPYLQKLDLSYNYLSKEALLNLGKLRCLKDLFLCGCGLKKLPQMFFKAFNEQSFLGRKSTNYARFVCLSFLDLSENLLTESAFKSLSGMPRLKILKLGHNKICGVPDLLYIHNQENLSFQYLSSLDLSNNQISYESSLLPATSWPSLRILMLWGNPIIDARKVDASILDENFEKLFDIEVIRQKPNHFLKNFSSSAKKVLSAGKIINKPIPSIKYNNLQLLNISNNKNKVFNEKQCMLFNEEAVPCTLNLEGLKSMPKSKNVFLTQLDEESQLSMRYSTEDDDFEELSIKNLPTGASMKRLKALLDKQKFSYSKNEKKSIIDKQMMANKALEDMRVKKTCISENLATILEQQNNSSEFSSHYKEVKKLAKSMQRKYDEVRKELLKPILLSYENEV